MTVGELIERLKDFDPTMRVYVEDPTGLDETPLTSGRIGVLIDNEPKVVVWMESQRDEW
jgi:hypothetical protein